MHRRKTMPAISLEVHCGLHDVLGHIREAPRMRDAVWEVAVQTLRSAPRLGTYREDCTFAAGRCIIPRLVGYPERPACRPAAPAAVPPPNAQVFHVMLVPGVVRGERDALERATAAAALRALEEAPGRGSVLCFLPGAGEVRQLSTF